MYNLWGVSKILLTCTVPKPLCDWSGLLRFEHFGTGCTEPITSQVFSREKGIDRPTQTPLRGFTLATHEPLKFCSDEYVFERFTSFV